LQHELPRRSPRRAPRQVEHHTIAIERGGRFLVQQRPAKGLWSSMWQLPTAEDLPAPVAAGDVAAWVSRQLGPRLATPRIVRRFTHQTTHRTIRFLVWSAAWHAGRIRSSAGVWRRLDDLDDLPLARPQQRIVQELRATGARDRELPIETSGDR
jgi:A/G-specific adenine glycosylase